MTDDTSDPGRNANGFDEDQRTLLLIDDDPVFAEMLGRAIERRGLAVTLCTSASAAKEQIDTLFPDFAVVDLRLPDGSGLCLVTELKQRSPGTEVIVLTGYGSIASAVEAIKLGAANYLCKPVDADTVLNAFAEFDTTRYQADDDGFDGEASQPLSVMRLEWEYINRVLAENDGNISATARALNMHRRTLQRKLTKRPVRR